MQRLLLLAGALLILTACRNPLDRAPGGPQGGRTPELAARDWVRATQGLKPDDIDVLAIQPVGQSVLVAYDYTHNGTIEHALSVTTLKGPEDWRVETTIQTTHSQDVGTLLRFHEGGLQSASANVFAIWGRPLSDQVGRVRVVVNGVELEGPVLAKGFIIPVPGPVAQLQQVQAVSPAGEVLSTWQAQ
ncbi:MAG: hypothetical protein M5U01_24650 [Ardenticatenaceae bacterium]|nr:hypothetical protein [Ardenticatenaceae bacterium]